MSTRKDLLKLNKKELIKLCKKHKLKTTGQKKDMIDRLLTNKSFAITSPKMSSLNPRLSVTSSFAKTKTNLNLDQPKWGLSKSTPPNRRMRSKTMTRITVDTKKKRSSSKSPSPSPYPRSSSGNWSKKLIFEGGVIPVVIGEYIYYNSKDGIGKYNPQNNKICKSWKYEDFDEHEHYSSHTASPSCSIGKKLYIYNGNTGELMTFNTISESIENVLETYQLGPFPSCAKISDDELVIVGDGIQSIDGAQREIYNVKTGEIKTYKDDSRFDCVNGQIIFKYKDKKLYRFGGFHDGNSNRKFYVCDDFMKRGSHSESEWEWKEKQKWIFPCREYVPMAWIQFKTRLFTFGGQGDDGFTNAIYQLNLTQGNKGWKKSNVTVPKNCDFTGAVYIEKDNSVHIFGRDEEWQAKHYAITMTDLLADDGDFSPVSSDDEKYECEECKDHHLKVAQWNLDFAKLRTENDELKKLVEELRKERDEYKEQLRSQTPRELRLKDYKTWSADDLVDWIVELDDGKYKEHEENLRIMFNKEGVSGQVLTHLDTNDLRGYGIHDFMMRKNIYKHIQDLISNESNNQ